MVVWMEDRYLPHLVSQVVEMVHVGQELPNLGGSMHYSILDRESSLRVMQSMLALVPMSLAFQQEMTWELLPDQLLPDPVLLEPFSDPEFVELELVGLDDVALVGWPDGSPLVCSFALREFGLVVYHQVQRWPHCRRPLHHLRGDEQKSDSELASLLVLLDGEQVDLPSMIDLQVED